MAKVKSGAGVGHLLLCSLIYFSFLVPQIYCHHIETLNKDEPRNEETVLIKRSETLSQDFSVSWTADLKNKNITFIVTGKTRGFIGFGISPQGGMSIGDVVIGGIDDATGAPYFTDRYASGKEEPKIDDSQDWRLLAASQNGTHTTLEFSRALDTCDDQDLPITNDTTKFIWSLGASDEITYHEKRGVAAVNLLDSRLEIVDTSKFDVWNITVNTTLPTQDTIYWCTVHKSPEKFKTKQHLVGVRVKLENQLAIDHNHHLILHKCHTVPGSQEEEQLEDFVGKVGGQCYDDDGSKIVDLMEFCQSYMFVWAKGGFDLFLPDNVGLPLNENGFQEYFLLEIHYDNPGLKPNLTYETGVTIFTTSKLREQDAGLLTMGHDINIALVVPPNVKDHVTVGHCSSGCTQSKIPSDGINVFNILLHSHFTGRKLKLRHFRKEKDENGAEKMKELSWIAENNNFEFDYQQNRPLIQPVKILPGDQLTYECVQDSTYKNPDTSVVLGGMTARDEMCETHMLYFPRIQGLDRCGSTYPLKKAFSHFGIESVNWTSGRDPLVLYPTNLAGHKYSTVLNTMVNWTEEFKSTFGQAAHFEDHEETCLSYNDNVAAKYQENPRIVHPLARKLKYVEAPSTKSINLVNYPQDYLLYHPPQSNCSSNNTHNINIAKFSH